MRLLLDMSPFQGRTGQRRSDELIFANLAAYAADRTKPFALAIALAPIDEQDPRGLVGKLRKVGVPDCAFGFYRNRTADYGAAQADASAPDIALWQPLRRVIVTAHYRERAPQAICIPAAAWTPGQAQAATPFFGSLNGIVCSVIVSDTAILDAQEAAGLLDDFITSISQSAIVFANGKALVKRLVKAGVPEEKLQIYAPERKGADIFSRLEDEVEQRRQVHRPRIAWVSPMPPSKSGISFFSEEVVGAMVEQADVTVFAENEIFATNTPSTPTGLDIRHYKSLLDVYQEYDSIVYHVGNSPFHVHMLDMLRVTGGIAVLHDLYLGHLMYAYSTQSGGDLTLFSTELADAYPDLEVPQGWTQEKLDEIIQNYAMARPFIDAADCTIVHSHYARNKAMEFYPDLQPGRVAVARQPHAIPALDTGPDKKNARERLGIGQDEVVVVSLGYITPQKGVAELYEACKAVREAGTKVSLHLVGVATDPWALAFLESLRTDKASGLVHVAGFVTDEQYKDYLKAADIGVQLRSFTRGETSRAVLDLLAYGIATIVTNMGDMSEYPDDVVVKLPPNNSVAALTKSIQTLAASNEHRRDLGEAAREYLEKNHSIDAYIQTITQAVEIAAQRRMAPKPQETIRNAVDTLPEGGDSEKMVDLLVGDLAYSTDLPARIARQPRLLVDITAIFHHDSLTGIQRVVRDLTYNLHQVGPMRDINPQCFRWDAHRYTTNDEFLFRREKRVFSVPPNANLAVHPRDIVLMLDASWNLYDKFFPLFDQIEESDGKVYTVVYDLVPQLYPELTDPSLVIVFDRWLRDAAMRSHGLICISKAVADQVVDHIKTEKIAHRKGLKVGWFHLGSDLRPAANQTDIRDEIVSVLQDDAPTFLMVSTIEPRKRHAAVLDAMELLWEKGSNARLVLMGREGWQIAEVAKRLRRHPENGRRLFWFEHASDAEITYGYTHANALVFASVYEGYGLPVTEAALAGLPVICSDIPVLREIAGKGATYFEVDNPESIATALQRFIDNPDAAKPSDVNVRTWSQSATQLLDIIQNDKWMDVLE